MITYNLTKEEEELLERAIFVMIQTYDQHTDEVGRETLLNLRRRIRESTKITLTTEVKNGIRSQSRS